MQGYGSRMIAHANMPFRVETRSASSSSELTVLRIDSRRSLLPAMHREFVRAVRKFRLVTCDNSKHALLPLSLSRPNLMRSERLPRRHRLHLTANSASA